MTTLLSTFVISASIQCHTYINYVGRYWRSCPPASVVMEVDARNGIPVVTCGRIEIVCEEDSE